MRRSPTILLVLVAVLALAACSSGPNDDAIVTDVKAKFFSDPQLKAADIAVSSTKGVVTLAGEVPTEGARYQAYKMAQEAQGVVKVEDKMTVAIAQAAVPVPVEPEPVPAPAPRRVTPRPAAPAPQAQATPPPPSPVATQPAAPAAPAAPVPIRVTIPSGTSVQIRMIDSVDSETDRTGQIFRASLDAPITVDGDTVVPTGTDVFVRLTESKSAGRIAGRSELQLELARMEFQDRTYQLVSSTYEEAGKSRGKDSALKIGGGAAIGAAIGAIAGGGKGAAIGAGIGAGAGTAVQVLTKGQQVRIPSETSLDFRLESPVDVTYLPERNTSRRSPSN